MYFFCNSDVVRKRGCDIVETVDEDTTICGWDKWWWVEIEVDICICFGFAEEISFGCDSQYVQQRFFVEIDRGDEEVVPRDKVEGFIGWDILDILNRSHVFSELRLAI